MTNDRVKRHVPPRGWANGPMTNEEAFLLVIIYLPTETPALMIFMIMVSMLDLREADYKRLKNMEDLSVHTRLDILVKLTRGTLKEWNGQQKSDHYFGPVRRHQESTLPPSPADEKELQQFECKMRKAFGDKFDRNDPVIAKAFRNFEGGLRRKRADEQSTYS